VNNLELVAAELEAAKKKHPKFVDRFTHWNKMETRDTLQRCRESLREHKVENSVEPMHVLQCELAETYDAYARGKFAHAVQELAQCAAVCIRAMEYIEKEMEEKK